MGLDTWFRQDVERMLATISITMANAGIMADREYQKGVQDTLIATATAFGISWPRLRQIISEQLEGK